MVAGGIMMGFGMLSIAYFILYAVHVDLNNVFTYFWLVLGGMLLVSGFLIYRLYHKGDRLPKWLVVSAGSVCGALVLFFAIMIGLIAKEAHSQPQPDADYMIVLGARVKGDRISPMLRYRLDKALVYLSDNPDTTVIVSGGQGPGENLSEAAAMQDYLVQKGIDSERILMDDTSLNTDENIRNSIELIRQQELEAGIETGMSGEISSQHIILLSNGFHLFRATRIMKKQIRDMQEHADTTEDVSVELGEMTIEGLGAHSRWYLAPNSYVREVFAVVKYKLCGQI